MERLIRVAACHQSPIFLCASDTTKKAIECINEAASNSANLIVFAETFIPAFPIWSALQAPTQNHGFFQRMVKESIYADGEEIAAICAAAKKNQCVVSIGFSEKVHHSSATLYNSNVLIGADGKVLVHHRKLMPTFYEKLTWSPGDGHGLEVAVTQYGKIGVLICGENTNPLARYTLMAQGEQVHISTWPAIWPTKVPTQQFDTEERGQISSTPSGKDYDNVAANRLRSAAHCFEAKCFGISCASYLDQANIEALASGSAEPGKVRSILSTARQAPTMFVNPAGTALPGFTIDLATGEKETKEFLQDKPGILYADLDLDDCIEGKQYHDVTGGYQRLDVFDLKVNRTRRDPVTFVS